MNGFELLGRKIKVSMATSDHAPASAVGSAAGMMMSPWGAAGGMGVMGAPNFQVDPNSMLAAMGYGRPAVPSAVQSAAATAQASLAATQALAAQPPLPPSDSASAQPPPLPPAA
ncbi:MAG: hypothetical protein EOO41_05825 [Methanobacteriota archaeon]|nr:MAG: hypothetical protein EOO41_05825 [Euryarchaeota archaeon]